MSDKPHPADDDSDPVRWMRDEDTRGRLPASYQTQAERLEASRQWLRDRGQR